MIPKRFVGRHEDEEGEEDGDGSSPLPPKRPRTAVDEMSEVVAAKSMRRLLSKLEPFFRRVVQEEAEKALCHYARSVPRLPMKQIQSNGSRPYQLRFQGKLPHRLFTASRIEAVGNMPVQIIIIDTVSNEIITSGPLSTTKIEIIVLDGDFDGDREEAWTEQEFSDSIVREREGKKPLLTGELVITLNSGVGCVGNVIFTDNSSWIRSRKFRLGARLLQKRCSEGRVREAITEAFLVKEHRGESYKKHHPPAFSDEVWRLEKIGKDGVFHKRLVHNGIGTVHDFLKLFVLDQKRLRNLLGKGMTNKIWDATVEHVKECVPNDRLYSYTSGQGVVLLFNSIFQLIGVIFDNIKYPLDCLTASQKVLINELRELASKNPNDIVEFNELLVGSLPSPLHMTDVSFHESCVVPQVLEQPAILQVEPAVQLRLQSQPQAPCLGSHSQLKDTFTGQILYHDPCFGSFQSNGFGTNLQCADFPMNGSMESMTTREHLIGFNSGFCMPSSLPTPVALDHLQASCRSYGSHIPSIEACISSYPVAWNHGNATTIVTCAEATRSHDPHLSGTGSRILSGKWVKVVAALKWMAISKRVAAKRSLIKGLDHSYINTGLFADVLQGDDWCLMAEDRECIFVNP